MMMLDEVVYARPSVRIPVIVTACACGDEVAGWSGGALEINVVADDADGSDNAAVAELVAEVLGVDSASVRVVAGRGARAKWLEVDGCGDPDVERCLPGRAYSLGAEPACE